MKFGHRPINYLGPLHHPVLTRAHQRLQLIHELRNIFELKIDGGKTHVGDLIAIEGFTPAVLLNHHVRYLVDSFVRGKAPLALQAFTSPADRIALARFARVNDFVFEKTAKGAFHKLILTLAFLFEFQAPSASATFSSSTACSTVLTVIIERSRPTLTSPRRK